MAENRYNMNFRQKTDKYLEKVIVFLVIVLVLDVLWQVISRYILGSPSSFTDELAGFLLIWVGLIGAAYVAGKGEHLAIDLLIQRSDAARQRLLQIIINSLVFLFSFLVMTVGGSWLVYTRFALEVKSAALEIPLGYIYLVLPFNGILICYYSLDNAISFIKKKN